MTTQPALSHAIAETTPALLDETIGDNFDATVARVPDRDAMVEFESGRRWTYAELRRDVLVRLRVEEVVGPVSDDRDEPIDLATVLMRLQEE